MPSTYRWERRRRDALLPVAVGAVGLLALVLAQAIPNRHSIEDDLTRRSVQALRTAGLSTVNVRFEGRDGTLRVSSPSDVDRALAVVRAQEGVRVARAEVSGGTKAPVTPPAVKLAIDGGRVILTGTVPTQAARTSLANAAAAFGAGAVDDGLTVDAGVSDAGLSGLGGILSALGKDASGAVVELRDGAITLTGTVPTQAAHDAAVQAAGQATGKPSAVVDRLRVAAPQPASPQEVQNRLATLTQVSFHSGSATLTPEGQAVVVQVGDVLKANPGVRIRIEGHTDSTGSGAANQALSQARALTVQATLRSLGIAADRLSALGFGASRPKVPDTTPANQAINRRVEFIVLP